MCDNKTAIKCKLSVYGTDDVENSIIKDMEVVDPDPLDGLKIIEEAKLKKANDNV